MKRRISTPLRIKTQRMNRLRELVSLPFWNARDASFIIAGVHPDQNETFYHPQQGWCFSYLPDGRRQEWLRNDGSYDPLTFEGNFEGERKWVWKFICNEGKESHKSPSDWLQHANMFEYKPPWQDKALQDKTCKKHLGLRIEQPLNMEVLTSSNITSSQNKAGEAKKTSSPTAARIAQPLTEVALTSLTSFQSKGGKAKEENSAAAAVEREIIKLFEIWKKNPDEYANKEDFEKDMISKCVLKGGEIGTPDFPSVKRAITVRKRVDKVIALFGPCPH